VRMVNVYHLIFGEMVKIVLNVSIKQMNKGYLCFHQDRSFQ
jgi:hypothetical protein